MISIRKTQIPADQSNDQHAPKKLTVQVQQNNMVLHCNLNYRKPTEWVAPRPETHCCTHIVNTQAAHTSTSLWKK